VRMPFGKHKGEDIDDVPRDYLRWVLSNVDLRDHGLKRAICDRLDMPAEQPRAPEPPVGAIEKLIRAWHRAMALKYHPDRGGSHDAMVAVNDGAEILRALAKQIAGAA
jgi:hypothetical protein